MTARTYNAVDHLFALGITRVTSLGPTLLFAAIVALSGCAAKHGASDFSSVSGELKGRFDHELKPEGQSTEFSLPPGLNLDDGVSETEAEALSLWNNAAFNETLSELGFTRAELVQAGLLTNPSFSVLFPLGPKQLEFTATFPLEALWLRSRRLAIARLQVDRAAQTLVQHGLNLIRDVRVACADLWLARERVRLAKAALAVRQRIGELSEARLRAGDLSELEAATARVDALRAADEATQASHGAAIQEQRLRTLIGIDDRSWQFTFEPPKLGLLLPTDELERQALASRPDLRAAELGVEAAAKRAGLAKAEIFALTGVLDANESAKGGLDMGPGLQLPIPIFNRNQAGLARAKAEMERAAWNYLAVKDRIRLEVREAYERFTQAHAALQQWEQTIMPPLQATAVQSQKAFELGNVSFLFVQENARDLINARVRYAEIVAETRRAQAELERGVGRRLNLRL